jgi:hypothetical protein
MFAEQLCQGCFSGPDVAGYGDMHVLKSFFLSDKVKQLNGFSTPTTGLKIALFIEF